MAGTPGAALSRAGQRAHVRLDPLGAGFGDAPRSSTSRRSAARPFSVRDWVRSGQGRAVHSLPRRADRRAALDHCHLDAARDLRGDERAGKGDQRLWFVVDELDALGAIDGLKDALARLRKFGGRCVLGFQSIAQVSATYGSGRGPDALWRTAATR